MENKQQSELGTKNIGKLLFSMAVPAITAQITEFVKQVVAFNIKNIFRYFRFAIDMEPLPI